MTKPLSAETSMEHQTISRDELRARLRDRSLIILDILPKEAYAEAHIPGAVSLPVAEIESKSAPSDFQFDAGNRGLLRWTDLTARRAGGRPAKKIGIRQRPSLRWRISGLEREWWINRV